MSSKPIDPYYDREKDKYAFPIPSREFILQTLADFGRPIAKNQLLEKLTINTEQEQEAIGFRLKAMLRDGQLMQDRKGRFCLFNCINLQRGRVQGHADGFGYFIPDDADKKDMVLAPVEMRSVMHNDLVLAYPIGVDRRGRMEAKIHEVIERGNTTVVGRFFTEHGVSTVVPDNKRITQDITILPNETNNATNGQIVLVEIIAFPSRYNPTLGKVVHVLGDHLSAGMEIIIAIHAHHLPATFSAEVLQEVGKIPAKVTQEDIVGRKDLRDLPFVTIDGEDAKDFDDAVYCKKTPKGEFQLFVAIADVSHYVKIGSALDNEALLRGNSVYFPGKVIPMLPEALSNGICSLNPKVDRLCMVAEIIIASDGKKKRSKIYRAVFNSHARLTYTQVGDWIKNATLAESEANLWPHIKTLHELYLTLRTARKKRGAIDFETTETSIIFDENKKIKEIKPVIRNDAHRLIEECMLMANVAVAEFLANTKLPVLYRVHPPPEEEKITLLRQFLSELGLRLPGGEKPAPKDFQTTLTSLANRPERKMIEMVMLRSLKQAQYIEENAGHFGLAYDAYTHFTSPIRRYPDLIIHRALAAAIDNASSEEYPYNAKKIKNFGKHCSMTERRADEATREAVLWLKCEYMQNKLGQTFTGTITGVTAFGLFVELDEIFVEGLVHISNLKSDYYQFDPSRHHLIGSRTGHIFRLGEKMSVIVARVDLDDRKIDFDPVGEFAHD
ncbi:MAG: ribonuclease R [Legionellales bacterium RIFCSPHIGHO2_12_FULL_37_14]|nr:MAG: ribonuclease R [Legionellales bacterium RIFCSPHIGHO2_12_FULL_37_14]